VVWTDPRSACIATVGGQAFLAAPKTEKLMNVRNKTIQVALGCLTAVTFGLSVAADESADTRQLIEVPQDIEQKMLANMRDHIVALDEIIHAINAGEYEKAEDIAEFRLGWSSLVRLDDQDVANHWATPMQKMADQMYRSASNFVIVSQNASVEDSKKSVTDVLEALGTVTNACRNCHQAFRIR
jgi:hypothetical protein